MMKNMLNRLKKKQNKKGFTLVEIIVVLVILAILAAIAVPAVLGYIDDAKQSKYIAEARSIYLVVQTEEAKYKASNPEKFTTTDSDSEYEIFNSNLYPKLTDKYTFNGIEVNSQGEGIISSKTGIEVVKNIEQRVSNGKLMHDIIWISEDGKTVDAYLYKNSKVKIEYVY